MLRKFTALLIALSMLTFPVMAQETEDTYDEYARNLLIGLSLMNEDEATVSDAAQAVTRAELARVLVRLSGNDVSVTGENAFTDVPDSHPDYAYIYHSSLLGFMSGDGAGSFRPDDNILTEEAAAGFVRLLGYGTIAGAYPEGYYNMAIRLGLFTGATIERGKNISKADLVKLTKNALDIDLMLQTDYTNGGAYEILEKETVLTYNLRIRRGRGIIDKNHIAGLTVTSGTGEGKVCINGVEFLAGKTNAAELLGYRAEFYYKEAAANDGEKELLYIDTQNFNDILVIDSDDIADLQGSILTYTNDRNKPDSIILSAKADLLYNGVPAPFAKEDIKITDGYISLIDNDRDNEYDVISVEKYTTLVVERVDSTNGIIYSKYKAIEQNFTYNRDDVGKKVFFYDRKGNLYNPSGLGEWDVISIKRDKEKKRTFVYTTVTEVKGTVSAVSEEDGYEICVNDKWYKVADYIKADAQLGDTRFFYLDLKGKIVASRESESSDFFWAYVCKGATEGALSTKYVLQIFEESGNVIVRDVAKNLKINDTPYKTVSAQKTACEAIFDKIVKVKLNDLGEIHEILTEASGEFSQVTFKNTSGIYTSNAQIFGGEVALKSDTLNFRVSTNGDTEKYKIVVGSSSWPDKMEYKKYKDYKFFVSKGSLEADVVLMKYDGTKATSTSLPCYIVDRYVHTRDADGEYVIKLFCYNRTTAETVIIKDENIIRTARPMNGDNKNIEIGRGDIIRVGTGVGGYAYNLVMVYDASEDDLYVGTTGVSYSDRTDYAHTSRSTRGYIYDISGGVFILAATAGDASTIEAAPKELHRRSVPVVVYNEAEDEIRTGTLDDAYSYMEAGENATRAIVYTRNGNPYAVFLYR